MILLNDAKIISNTTKKEKIKKKIFSHAVFYAFIHLVL